MDEQRERLFATVDRHRRWFEWLDERITALQLPADDPVVPQVIGGGGAG